MSNLIVIVFDDSEEAGKVRDTIRSVERMGEIRLDDSAVVIKDASGKIHVKNEVDRGVKVGAIGGGFLGILIGGIFFPLAGLLAGALIGAVIGKFVDLGVDQKFVKEVSDALEPGKSALFIIVRDSAPDVAIAALKPYKGTVFHTTLTPEQEENLRGVLKTEIK